MMKLAALASALLVAAASPALAVTESYNFVRPSGSATGASFIFAGSPAGSISVAAGTYAVAPSSLVSLGQLVTTGPQVFWGTAGLGVVGGANSQVDGNMANAREALLLTSTNRLGLTAAKFSWTDANDTIKIYGINANNSLSVLAQGNIRTGFTGATIDPSQTSALGGNTNANFARLLFAPQLAAYDRYLFTAELPGSSNAGQGFFLSSLDGANVVPEPMTWAMLVAGFGLVGAMQRRRSRSTVVA